MRYKCHNGLNMLVFVLLLCRRCVSTDCVVCDVCLESFCMAKEI